MFHYYFEKGSVLFLRLLFQITLLVHSS